MIKLFNLKLNIKPCFYILKYHFHVSSPKQLNCYRASLGKIGRKIYPRMYPTFLVFSDGSSISFRYHEPRQIIKLPVDVTQLTEEERQKRIQRRKPKTKIVIEEELEEDFSIHTYEHLWKK